MRSAKTLLVSAGLVGLLAACSAPQQLNTVRMTAADAKATADLALSDLSMAGAMVNGPAGLTAQSAQRLGLPLGAAQVMEGLGMDLNRAVTARCDFDATPRPEWADKDLDGVPVLFEAKIDCEYTSETFGYSFSGGLKLEDNDDTKKDSGFKLTLDKLKQTASRGSKSLERTFDGSYALDTATPGLYKLDKGYTAAQKYTDGTQTDSASVQYEVSEKYQPKDPAKPRLAGTFTVEESKPGSLAVTRNLKSYKWNWFTQPSLAYDAACRARTDKGVRIPFTGGAAVYTYTNPDGKTSTLKIAFESCGKYAVTLDGNPL